MITQQTQVNSDIVVSYVVALHIWFIVCTTFIFLALLELALALIYCQRIQDSKETEKSGGKKKESLESASLPVTPRIETVFFGRQQQPQTALPAVNLEMTNVNNHHSLNNMKNRSHSYQLPLNGEFPELNELSEKEKETTSRKTSHVIKTILNQVYGEVDWRKSPQVRNKIDYVSRILFPTSFAIFVFVYFFILHYR